MSLSLPTSPQQTLRLACRTLRRALLGGFGVLILPAVLLAQGNNQYTKTSPDQLLRGDARIDPATHALSIQIPLGVYAGRAGVNLPVSITYSSRFRHLEFDGDFQPYSGREYDFFYLYFDTNDGRSVAGWTASLAPPHIEGDPGGYDGYFGINVGQPGGNDHYIQSIARMRIFLGDGSSHELRKDDIPRITAAPDGPYYAVDGSQLRFEGTGGSQDTGTLFVPDGSRYLFVASQATQYIDRHGNTLSYNGTSKQWTDTLGRTFTSPLSLPYAAPAVGNQQYVLAGINGSSLVYTYRWRYLRNPDTNETVLTDPNQEVRRTGNTASSSLLPAQAPTSPR